MDFQININNKNYSIDINQPLDISLPVHFSKKQISIHRSGNATKKTFLSHELIGDIRRGGSLNCHVINFIPHFHGTHTQYMGHVISSKSPVYEHINKFWFMALLISVAPEKGNETIEEYAKLKKKDDLLITKKRILKSTREHGLSFLPDALIIRTLPNSESKKEQNYDVAEYPFFSFEAMELIIALKIKHLLTDTPFIDKKNNDGNFYNYQKYWNVNTSNQDIVNPDKNEKGITELIFVDNHIKDGYYLLNLQLSSFDLDAVPSRPVLYSLSKGK